MLGRGSATSSALPLSPATRSTATSLRTSNATTSAERYFPSRRSTRESRTPATTWAFVTTRPGPAIQPEPSIPRPQAVPVTRTTDGAACLTPGRFAMLGSGGATAASGPGIESNGSTRAIASIRRWGGNSRLIRSRIFDACTSRRRSVWPGRLQRDRAEHPDERDAGHGAEHDPERRVEHPQRWDGQELPRTIPPAIDATPWSRNARPTRAAERDERRVRRVAVAQELRREPRTDVRADREPRQRERPADEPPPEPVQCREGDHGDRRPSRRGSQGARYDGRRVFPSPARLTRASRGRSSVG